MLSEKTIQKLAIALTPEIINYIYADEGWVNYMIEVIPEAVATKLKTENYDLIHEISALIFEHLFLKSDLDN